MRYIWRVNITQRSDLNEVNCSFGHIFAAVVIESMNSILRGKLIQGTIHRTRLRRFKVQLLLPTSPSAGICASAVPLITFKVLMDFCGNSRGTIYHAMPSLYFSISIIIIIIIIIINSSRRLHPSSSSSSQHCQSILAIKYGLLTDHQGCIINEPKSMLENSERRQVRNN